MTISASSAASSSAISSPRAWSGSDPIPSLLAGTRSSPVCGRSAARTSARSARSAEPLFEAFLVKEVDAEQAVFIPNRNDGPVAVQRPFHSHDLLVAAGEIGDVGEGQVPAHLLFQREARLRIV